MTNRDRDELEGRVNRELREAQKALNEMLVSAEQVAQQIADLANEIKNRVERARFAGTHVEEPMRGLSYVQADAGIEFGRLKNFEKAVDLAAIDTLDREIGVAVARLLTARQQRAQLGV